MLGMTVYNESPNKVSPSISFAVFVDDSTEEKVRGFYGYRARDERKAVELEGTMSTYIGDGDRLGGFNEREHGASYKYMRSVKALFDPNNIMNPGKKFESRWIAASGRPSRSWDEQLDMRPNGCSLKSTRRTSTPATARGAASAGRSARSTG